MPLPQVSDRIKELPGQALRAVFAGVGQLLLAADKVRAQLAEPADTPAQPPAPASSSAAAAAPAVAPPAAPAPAAARPAPDAGDARWRSLDKTGNVRLLHDGDEELTQRPSTPPAAAAAPAPAGPASAGEPTAAQTADAGPAAEAQPAATAQPAAAAETALPLVGYDQLTLASLRARLRVLDVTQVRTLLEYERTHQGRTDVVTMFERRIAKLEQGG